MPQTVTIENVGQAFAMLKELQADRLRWGDDYRPLGWTALALLLVKRYGDDATLQAAQRADELLAEGDVDGAATWRRIMAAIEKLQAKVTAEGEKVH